MKKIEFEKIVLGAFGPKFVSLLMNLEVLGMYESFTSFYLCLLLFIKVNILHSGIDKTETVFCFISFFIYLEISRD